MKIIIMLRWGGFVDLGNSNNAGEFRGGFGGDLEDYIEVVSEAEEE